MTLEAGSAAVEADPDIAVRTATRTPFRMMRFFRQSVEQAVAVAERDPTAGRAALERFTVAWPRRRKRRAEEPLATGSVASLYERVYLGGPAGLHRGSEDVGASNLQVSQQFLIGRIVP